MLVYEVGYILGIVYNFVVSENECVFVMDYLYFKLIIVNGEISLEGVYDKGIGSWDKYVVVYGY